MTESSIYYISKWSFCFLVEKQQAGLNLSTAILSHHVVLFAHGNARNGQG